MNRAIALLCAGVLAWSPAIAAARKAPAPQPTPQAGATSFYNAYLKLRPSGISNAAGRNRLMPYITERLYKFLQDGDRAEARYAEATKHESPPLVEGDLFTSLFEGATSFKVGDCMRDGDMLAVCAINLTYHSEGDKDTQWTDTVHLVREQRRFRVDEIEYGGSWAFANMGRLSKTIADTIDESQKPVN